MLLQTQSEPTCSIFVVLISTGPRSDMYESLNLAVCSCKTRLPFGRLAMCSRFGYFECLQLLLEHEQLLCDPPAPPALHYSLILRLKHLSRRREALEEAATEVEMILNPK